MIKSVRVIGDGGAFDAFKVNSSFLIETDDGSILYDCGYNVFQELLRIEHIEDEKIIDKINTIIISHDDDDHMGSVKSFIFYKYFVKNNPSIKVFCPKHMIDMFIAMNKEMKGSVEVHANIVRVQCITYLRDRIDTKNIRMEEFKGIHHTEAYGIIVRDNFGSVVAISGDTKAQESFENRLRDIARENGSDGVSDMLIFHDYSEWNAPSRQVHACESDYEVEFSEEFKRTAKKYHNSSVDLAGRLYKLKDGIWVDVARKGIKF